jgi:hypothetical protein
MRRMLAVAIVALWASASTAGEIADRAAEAERLLETGQGLDIIETFEQAQDVLWTAMPLTIRRVVLVSEASGVGVYRPRGNNRFRADEALLLYIEPVGYGYGNDGLGNNVIELAVDLTLRTEAGELLGTIEDIGSIKVSSRSRNRELFFNLTLTFTGGTVGPGRYRAEFLMRDKNSSKTATFTVDFVILV